MEKDINIIIQKIDHTIDHFIEDNDIEDINKISSSMFNACLLDIHKFVFYDGIIKDRKISNEYDYRLVNDICDYYIYICFKYNKLPTIQGFSYMTGIDDNSIYRAGTGEVASSKDWELSKKILRAQENSLENGLNDGIGNPVGKIAILNHRFDWQTAAAAHGIEKKAKSADQLPDFRQNAQRLEDQKNNDSTQ